MTTQTKSASFYVAYILKKLWTVVALSLVVVAVSLSILRYSLPYMNEQKHHLEQWLSAQVGAELLIGEISAKWQGMGPAIVLRDVQLKQSSQSPISLNIAETAIEVDFWQSVLARQIQSNKFDLRNMQLTLDLTSLGQEENNYPIVDALEQLFLQQLQLFSISDSKIIINTARKKQVVLIDQVSWVNKEQHHQGTGQLQIQEIASNSASFILDLYGEPEQLRGTFYAKGEEVDLSPWVEQWVSNQHTLVESRASFVMWASIENKALQSVQLDLSNSRFDWQDTNNPTVETNIQASILGGQINARPVNNEWLVNLNNLTTQINDNVLVSNWHGKLGPSGTLSLQQKQPIKLAVVMPMLALGLNSQNMALLNEFQPQATLDSLQLVHSLKGNLAVKAAVSDLQWQQTRSIPGMAGLDADLYWYNSEGRISIKGKSGQLAIDTLLPANIDYQRIYADLYIQSAEQGMVFTADNTLFKSEQLTLSPHLQYRTRDNHLTLSSTIAPLDIEQLPSLYPIQYLGDKTRQYLLDALQTGQIASASILWHGALDQYPYAENQGVFQAKLEVEQGKLKFAPQWPALTNFDATVLFENQSLYMNSQQGRLMDVMLKDLSATISVLASGAVLNIDAKAQAKGRQVTDLMLHSNLADTLGKTLEQIQVSGPLTTQLNLHIPLNGDLLTAKGQVFLDNNQLDLPSLKVTLEQAKGQIDFVNARVDVNDLTAQLLKQPVKITLTGQQQTAGYQTDININGDWKVSPLLDSFVPSLTKYLSGNSAWQANIAVTLPSNGYQYSAEILSELTQIDSDLPAPFAKTREQNLPVLITSQGNQQASSIKITLGDNVEFNGNLPHADMQFSRAHLAIGESEHMGMGLGFSVSANMKNLDTSPWYDTIHSLISGLPTSGKPLLEAPKRIFINADSATIASQKLTDLDMVVKNTDDSWLLDINAKQARMEVALYKDWLDKGVNINADFINLAKWQSDEQTSDSTFSVDIDTLPPVNFSCSRCRFLDNDLGKVDFMLSRASTGMTIDSLRFNNANGLFYGSGDWFLTDGISSTRLKGQFSSSDFGAFLQGFKVNSGIKDSKASSTFDLSWQRAPYEFNFETLNGDIDWRLSDGYLTEISDQGSRIFSLLSLESLVRKLKLDFRDMFAKGFFYDKIKGSFQLENGIADTQDTIVDGGAGEITMRGYTDLSAQQLNYRIEFAPNVTSSLPVIIAYMVNPVTAVAALALDQMLTSAKVISNIKFSLTGTLDDPQLKELGRDSKEVALPARNVEPEPETQPVTDELDAPISISVPTESMPITTPNAAVGTTLTEEAAVG